VAAAVAVASQAPKEWPHWMEKDSSISYQSDKILGQFYDKVLQHPINEQLQQQWLLQQNNPIHYQ
jgi:hypothetical protein